MRCFTILLLLGWGIAVQAQSVFVFSNPPGPFAVGLHVVQQVDTTRAYKSHVDSSDGPPYASQLARPIRTLVWYPAQAGSTPPMRVRDYMRTSAADDVFNPSDARIDSGMAQMVNYVRSSLGAVRGDQVMAQAMWAVRDAKAVEGRFPVVVYAPGSGGTADENADLCEYLASQGYLVIASPSMGLSTRRVDFLASEIAPQAQDISFLINYAQTLPQADIAQIAVVGFSWGGMAALAVAAQDKRIIALVALDGSFRYMAKLAKQIPADKLTVPLLYLGQAKTLESLAAESLTLPAVDVSYSLMNDMHKADLYRITARPLQHNDFNSSSLRFNPDSRYTEYTREEASIAHSWVARYALQFLNAFLKNDKGGLAFLQSTPVANGAPAHMFGAEIQRANSLAPSRQ